MSTSHSLHLMDQSARYGSRDEFMDDVEAAGGDPLFAAMQFDRTHARGVSDGDMDAAGGGGAGLIVFGVLAYFILQPAIYLAMAVAAVFWITMFVLAPRLTSTVFGAIGLAGAIYGVQFMGGADILWTHLDLVDFGSPGWGSSLTWAALFLTVGAPVGYVVITRSSVLGFFLLRRAMCRLPRLTRVWLYATAAIPLVLAMLPVAWAGIVEVPGAIPFGIPADYVRTLLITALPELVRTGGHDLFHLFVAPQGDHVGFRVALGLYWAICLMLSGHALWLASGFRMHRRAVTHDEGDAEIVRRAELDRRKRKADAV